jgi:hypothetical protein
MKNLSRILPVAGWLLSAIALSGAHAEEPEIMVMSDQSATVATTKLVPASLLKSDAYTLAPQTVIYQGVAIYKMESEFGQSTLVGGTGLAQRIDELNAIDQLRAMKGSEVYKEALKKSGKAPVETVKNLAKEPVDTIKDIGRGLGGFLSDVGYSIVSKDPNQENVAKTAAGFAAAKRQLAYQLGVSPYSSFQPLQDEMSDVAWTAVGGSVTVSLGFSALDGAGTVLRATGSAESMRGLIRDNSPRKLEKINEEKLLAMGVSESLTDALLDNFNYNPEDETRMVGALHSMKDVPGRELFIQRAALQDQPYNARLMREWAELCAAYHENVEPVKAIVMAEGTPFMVRKDGSIQGVFPADFVTLDETFVERNAAVADALRAQGYQPGEAWVTGKVDPALVPALKKLGWEKVTGGAFRRVGMVAEG